MAVRQVVLVSLSLSHTHMCSRESLGLTSIAPHKLVETGPYLAHINSQNLSLSLSPQCGSQCTSCAHELLEHTIVATIALRRIDPELWLHAFGVSQSWPLPTTISSRFFTCHTSTECGEPGRLVSCR